MSDFTLDPALEAATRFLADWKLCRVFLYNDARYHWGVLVPRRPGAVEICDLEEPDRMQLMAEIAGLSQLVRSCPGVEKLNVGSLGNLVPQLHVHVVGRHKGDPAWPGPVWGHGDPLAYSGISAAPLAAKVRNG